MSVRALAGGRRASREVARSGGGLKGWIAPLLAGLVIDAIDFVTLGPIGLAVGFVAGFGVGWWLAPELGFGPTRRWLGGVLAGFYCMLPMTGFVPAATLLAGLAHVLDGSRDGGIGSAG